MEDISQEQLNAEKVTLVFPRRLHSAVIGIVKEFTGLTSSLWNYILAISYETIKPGYDEEAVTVVISSSLLKLFYERVSETPYFLIQNVIHEIELSLNTQLEQQQETCPLIRTFIYTKNIEYVSRRISIFNTGDKLIDSVDVSIFAQQS